MQKILSSYAMIWITSRIKFSINTLGRVITVFMLLFTPTLITAQSIPTSLGWYQIPGTNLRSVCPPNNFSGSSYNFSDFCQNVTAAWNSAVFDTNRNRLVIWGGGHGDYSGNEIYTLDLNTLLIQRLTDPGVPVATACPESIVNGTQPNSRHTYDGIEYMPNVDKLFVFGGSLATCGWANRGTWAFSFATNNWEKKNPTGTIPNGWLGIVSAYDPNSGKVFLHDDWSLYSYDPVTNNYQRLTSNNPIDYHMTATVDPLRKKFIIVGGTAGSGGGVVIYDIGPNSNYQAQKPTTAGGNAIINSPSPGLAYDPIRDRIVAWNGGKTVYELNVNNNTWTSITYTGGPGNAIPTGTFGRWQFSPASGVFVTINSVDANAFTLRLNPPDTYPPAPPTGLRVE